MWTTFSWQLEEQVSLLQKVWKIKVTGSLPWGQPGVLQFLGRQILREREGDGPLLFGLGRDYMSSLLNAWKETGEKLKPWTSKVMPNIEEIVKTFEHDAPLTKQAQLRFRKVLGMLAWVALSRSDLTCELEPSECIRWDRDLPKNHPEDVLAKAGRAGHVFGRG